MAELIPNEPIAGCSRDETVNRHMSKHSKIPPGWLTGAIFVLALLLRWPFPAPEWMHGDERAFVIYPLAFCSGDLNPHFFNYPTLQFYLISCCYYLYYLFFSSQSLDYFIAYHYFVEADDLLAIARGVNAVFSAATVVVCLYIGRRLYGKTGGLIAGLLLAIMPLHTRFAYLAITDVTATFCCALALLYALRIVQRPSHADLALAGVWAGLAAGCKYPVGLVLLPVLAACWLCRPARRLAWIPICAAGLAFAVTSPYILLDWPAFWRDFSAMGQDHLLGGHPLSSTTSWYYLLYPNLRYGLGWVGLLTLAIAPWYPRTGWRNEEWVLLIGIATFVSLLVAADSTFMRYALPLAPLLAVLLARPLASLTQQRIVLGACVLLLIAEPLYASLRFRTLLAGDDTRALARDWLQEHAPDNRYLLQVPKGGGQVLLFNSESVYLRMSQYQNSFGSAQLVQAFSLLAEGPPLPPIYFDRYFDFGWVPNERRHNLYSAPADSATGVLWALAYQYHLPLSQISNQDPLYLSTVEQLIQWHESFSVGAPEQAAFSAIDQHFVPLGGWAAVQATGPEIRIGTLPWIPTGPAPTTRQFFAAIAQALAGRQAMESGDWHRAATIYSTLQQVPFDLGDALAYSLLQQVFFGRAEALAALGDAAETYAAWEDAARRFPALAEPHFQMGLFAGDTGNYTRAIDHYQAALQRTPDDSVILYNLSLCLLHEERVNESVIALERANELAADADNYVLLARAYHLLKQSHQARAALIRARELDPHHPQIAQLEHILAAVPQ